MALYISAGRRRRTTIVVGIASIVLGIVLGFLLGRGTATTIDDRVAEARDAGRKLASSLRVLPLEYEKIVTADGSGSGAADIITRSLAKEQATLDTAPWLGDEQVAAVKEQLDVLRQAPGDDMSPTEFNEAVDSAAATVETTFGVARTESPS